MVDENSRKFQGEQKQVILWFCFCEWQGMWSCSLQQREEKKLNNQQGKMGTGYKWFMDSSLTSCQIMN